MLSSLKPQAPDSILMLIEEFKADTRQGKIDLGVGVYKDPQGVTPVMQAVKAAERRIWETQTTKAYTGLAGEPEYRDAMARMVLKDVPSDRLASLATVAVSPIPCALIATAMPSSKSLLGSIVTVFVVPR